MAAEVPGHPDVKITGVKVEWHEARDEWSPAHYSVTPVWSGVDRPTSSSWGVGKNPRLVKRLEAAILAGAVTSDPEVRTDVNGQTYVSYGHVVRARCLNADLRNLGF